jgi:amino acid transporter
LFDACSEPFKAMNLGEKLFGRRLRSDEEDAQQITPGIGIPVLGLDALASAAYGPESALTALIALGTGATVHMLSIVGVILVLLALLSLSYRQTIASYPQGGGAYTVAKENLGPTAGLIAASALCVD